MRNVVQAALCAVLAGSPLHNAFAWSPKGHQTVAIIAERILAQKDPAVLAAARKILGTTTVGTSEKQVSFADVSACADFVRKGDEGALVRCGGEDLHIMRRSQPWHFIGLDIDKSYTETTLENDQTCERKNCVTGEIRWTVHNLRDPRTTEEKKHEALIFLIHFMGDIHQPLHCGNEYTRGADGVLHSDYGGNGVNVTEFEGRNAELNLHSLWDKMVSTRDNADPESLASELMIDMADFNTSEWTQGSIYDIVRKAALESFEIAQGTIYSAYRATRKEPGGNYEIPKGYRVQMSPIAKRRIQMAGARLAYAIELGLGQQTP